MTAARPRFRSPAEHVNASAYDVVTDRVLALLERGTVPWRRPWNTTVDMPRNLQGRPTAASTSGRSAARATGRLTG